MQLATPVANADEPCNVLREGCKVVKTVGHDIDLMTPDSVPDPLDSVARDWIAATPASLHDIQEEGLFSSLPQLPPKDARRRRRRMDKGDLLIKL